MRRALLGVALATVAFSGVVTAQNTFCERYGSTEAAAQYGLVSGVVGRAVLGATAAQTGTIDVLGLVNEPNNRGYFNGTLYPFTDYTNPNNSAALTTLATHLNKFFTFALGCRNAASNATYQWSPKQMYRLHKAMGITPDIMTAFILQVGTSLASYGVVLGSPTDPSTEYAYLGGLLAQFYRYPTSLPDTDATTIFGNGLQICTNAACPLAHGIVQYHVDDANVLTQPGATSTSASIAVGDYVNFRFSNTSGIVQTDSATGTTALSGGLASTAGTRTFTVQMNNNGTFYFYALGAPTGPKAIITVGTSTTMSSTGMSTGTTTMTGSSSTGHNAAAASATLSVATLLAAAAAIVAIVA